VRPYRPRYTPEGAGGIRKLHPLIKREIHTAIRSLLSAPLLGQDLQFELSDDEIPKTSWGGRGQHWWTDRWRSTAVLGYVRVDNRSAEPSNAFKRAIDTLANLIYSPIKPLDVGIEYHWGQHEIKNGRTGHANRLMFSVKWRL